MTFPDAALRLSILFTLSVVAAGARLFIRGVFPDAETRLFLLLVACSLSASAAAIVGYTHKRKKWPPPTPLSSPLLSPPPC